MKKVRVYKLAKELGLQPKDLVEKLHGLDIEVKSHMSTLEEETAKLVLETYQKEKPEKAAEQEKQEVPEKTQIEIKTGITVADLATQIGAKSNELIKTLMKHNIFASLRDRLDRRAIDVIAKEFGIELSQPPKKEHTPVQKSRKARPVRKEDEKDLTKLKPRPPIITVMGHVNHGKTSILDAIRHTSIVRGEKGGITQHIGACKVNTQKGEIVFLDTPGHEAFTSMRARGAQVTDIVVLVIAADDGIMPQTEEAIDHARDAGVPIIAAINKIDKPSADPAKIKQELQQHDLTPEEFGGETICVDISATKGQGLDNLLEMILLQAEMMELKANPEGCASGTIIEGQLDKRKGPVASVIIQRGTLKVGDFFVAGVFSGKVKAMTDEHGKNIKAATPSTPVEILGFTGVPNAGEYFEAFENEKDTKTVAVKRQVEERTQTLGSSSARVNLETLYEEMQTGLKELKLIVKADVHGSSEALTQSLRQLSNDSITVNIIHSGVGEINERDVMLASASNAVIIGFHISQGAKAKQFSEKEHVDVLTCDVIYEAISLIKKAMTGLLEPVLEDVDIGKAEIREVFETSKGEAAGIYVRDGKVLRDAYARILRGNEELCRCKIQSLRRFKKNVTEVQAGFECGLIMDNSEKYKEGDTLVIFKQQLRRIEQM